MSNYNTRNPVPSIDPRDLDDNATNFDLLLLSDQSYVPDRLGVPRKTWSQMEADAAALVSPNVSALAGLTLSANKGLYATGAGALAIYTLTALGRTLGGIANAAAGRAALGAMALTDTDAYAGSAARLTTARTISATGDATWSVSFDGSSNATGTINLAASGVSAGTYGLVTVNAKGLVTSASVATPIANGGTGSTSAAAALTALGGAPLASPTFTGTPAAPTPTVGTNTTQVATTALIQAEIANKRAWTTWTPTITALAGSFTTVSATGSYVVIMGICHFRATLTFTAKGTGTFPFMSLPVNALAGSASWLFQARENAVSGAIGYGFIDGNLAKVYISGASGTTLVSADGAVISINGSYPVA